MSRFHSKFHKEVHNNFSSTKLNWLRAAVLGANDGIVSTAAVALGVAGATSDTKVILTASVAALAAGALSMAIGEYVSVSTQRDTEKALLQKEREGLTSDPGAELEELIALYEQKGLSHSTAKLVGEELTAYDALSSHAEVELHIDPHNLTNPWYAAYASGLAFFSGAIIPLLAIILAPRSSTVTGIIVSVVFALIVTGALSAQVSGSSKRTAIWRVVFGGLFAMIVTYSIGYLFGTL
jgi:vacuolar iron transporter family protein